MTNDTANKAAGTVPAPRRRGRPRKVLPPEEAAALAAKKAAGESNTLPPSMLVNPYGWGLDSCPPGRVRFMRFYTWSFLSKRIISMRDISGRFLAPGCVACIQATRSAGPVIDALRQRARLTGTPFFIQQLFMPVVYPGVSPFRYWQHCANPFDQNLVTLHQMHKKLAETQLRAHFPDALPPGVRFTISTIPDHLLEHRRCFRNFFDNPANDLVRGILWRAPASLVAGSDIPQPQSLINYAVIRPEWVVDAKPLDSAPDLVGPARSDPGTCLARVARLLVMDNAAYERARQSEEH